MGDYANPRRGNRDLKVRIRAHEIGRSGLEPTIVQPSHGHHVAPLLTEEANVRTHGTVFVPRCRDHKDFGMMTLKPTEEAGERLVNRRHRS